VTFRGQQAAGFGAHITKPIKFQNLDATMRRMVLADDPAAFLSLVPPNEGLEVIDT